MAVIYLQGLLEDGTTVRDPLVPVNPRATLQLTQDCAAIVRVAITNPAGVPVPSTGTLVLTIKKRPQDIPALAQFSGTWVTSINQGVADFSIAPAALHELPWGRYCYDVKLTTMSSTDLVVPTSPLQLLPAVSTSL